MCYTAEDSLNAYIINLVSSIILFINTSRPEIKVASLFLLFMGQMQIFDYMFWKNIECNGTNKLVTKAAIVANHLQPIVLFVLLTVYGYKQNTLSMVLLVSYAVVALIYTTNLWPSSDCDKNSNTNSVDHNSVCCSLPFKDKPDIMEWKWNYFTGNKIVYLLFLLYIVVAWANVSNGGWFGVISVFIFLISTKIPDLNRTVGRVWCYLAAFIPLFMLSTNIK